MIEVNGLEPKDVTRTNTPFLWALAHSGDSTNDAVANSYPALSGRNGWAWQAARGVMSTGNGPATASLLTGGTAEQTGIPSDLFRTPDNKWYATGTAGGSCTQPDPCDPSTNLNSTTILSLAQQSNESVGMWIGDPALCSIVNSGLSSSGGGSVLDDWIGGGPNGQTVAAGGSSSSGTGDCPSVWAPGPSSSSSPSDQSPYCPPPSAWPSGYYPNACPAPDSQTLEAAAGSMTSGIPTLSYIYLAEIGAVKQLSGDNDCFASSSPIPQGSGLPQTGCGSSPEPPAVTRALQSTDAALAAFASDVQNSQGAEWSHTYLMIVGNHGYEATPPALRVPNPNAINAATSGSAPSSSCPGGTNTSPTGPGDLSCFVKEDSTVNGRDNAILVPQGTMATIYYQGPTDQQTETSTLQKLYSDLCGTPETSSGAPALGPGDQCSSSSTANVACAQLLANGSVPSSDQASPDCIQHVYYVDPSVLDPSAMQNSSGGYDLSKYLFGEPGDPGYPTASNPSYNPNPHCSVASSPFYDSSGNCDANLLSFYQSQQASWHLNALSGTPAQNPTTFAPTGASGQLVVEFAPGWAGGPLAGVDVSQTSNDLPTGTLPAIGTPTDPVDPYLASSGGPRDRAIAAIINGPAPGGSGVKFGVVQYPDSLPGSSGDGLAPVTNDGSQTPSDPTFCSTSYLSNHPAYQDPPGSSTTPSTMSAVDQANAAPGNDSAALGSSVYIPTSDSYVPPGYECQAQTIDFAPTIAALQGMQFPSTQDVDARLLDEAFGPCKPNCLTPVTPPENLGAIQPQIQQQAPPVVIPPPVIIYKLPKPPKQYDFYGLIRNVQAQVVDQRNDTVPEAPPGAYLSSIRITADFGKPLSQVTITLYRDAGLAAATGRAHAHAAPHRLTAIVRFCPFTVTRDPNVQLRFEVPPAYQATHVGLAVREAQKLTAATGPGCGPAHHNAFVAVGPLAGAIVPILDSQLLHKVKPCPTVLSVALPHGPGVTVLSATVIEGRRIMRVLPAAALRRPSMVIPASQLPGGLMQVRVVALERLRGKQVTRTLVSPFYNCSQRQERRLSQRWRGRRSQRPRGRR